MATLLLERVWVNVLATGEAVSAFSRDRSQGYDQDGDVDTFAGGRQRSIAVEGERGTHQVTLRMLPLATVTLLRSWMGVAVQVRDKRGQVWVATFFSVTPTELPNSTWYDVTIVLRTITAVEGV